MAQQALHRAIAERSLELQDRMTRLALRNVLTRRIRRFDELADVSAILSRSVAIKIFPKLESYDASGFITPCPPKLCRWRYELIGARARPAARARPSPVVGETWSRCQDVRCRLFFDDE